MNYTLIYSANSDYMVSKNSIESLKNIQLNDSECEIVIIDSHNIFEDNIINELPFDNKAIIRRESESIGNDNLISKALAEANGENIIFAESNNLFSRNFLINLSAFHMNHPHDLIIVLPKGLSKNNEINPINRLLNEVNEYFENQGETVSFGWLFALSGIFAFKKRYLYRRFEFNSFKNSIFQNVDLAYRIGQKGYKCTILGDIDISQLKGPVSNIDLWNEDWRNIFVKNDKIDFHLIRIIKDLIDMYIVKCKSGIDEAFMQKFIMLETALRCYQNKFISKQDLCFL